MTVSNRETVSPPLGGDPQCARWFLPSQPRRRRPDSEQQEALLSPLAVPESEEFTDASSASDRRFLTHQMFHAFTHSATPSERTEQ